MISARFLSKKTIRSPDGSQAEETDGIEDEERQRQRLTGIDISVVDVLDIPRIEAPYLAAIGDLARVHIDHHQFFPRSHHGVHRRAGRSLNHGFGRREIFEDVMHHTFDVDQEHGIPIEIGHQQTIVGQGADARRCAELAVFTIERTRQFRNEVVVLVLLQVVDQLGRLLLCPTRCFRLFRRGDLRAG